MPSLIDRFTMLFRRQQPPQPRTTSAEVPPPF
jgi:hypothetical protein